MKTETNPLVQKLRLKKWRFRKGRKVEKDTLSFSSCSLSESRGPGVNPSLSSTSDSSLSFSRRNSSTFPADDGPASSSSLFPTSIALIARNPLAKNKGFGFKDVWKAEGNRGIKGLWFKFEQRNCTHLYSQWNILSPFSLAFVYCSDLYLYFENSALSACCSLFIEDNCVKATFFK